MTTAEIPAVALPPARPWEAPWWRADPSNNSVLIFLAHNMVELEQLMDGIGLGVFDAITQFQAQASSLLR